MARKKTQEVDLKYLGPAGIFIDTETGSRWVVGQVIRVSSEDANRIVETKPIDKWDSAEAVGPAPKIPEPPKEKPYHTTPRNVPVPPENATRGFEVH